MEGPDRTLWGPRAPQTTAAFRGATQIVVNYAFEDINASDACRPQYVQVVVVGHVNNKHRASSSIVLVESLRASVTTDLPRGATEVKTFYVRIRALGADRAPSPETKIRLDRR